MLEIEKEIGAKCSYYFRLRTMDVPFMKKIEDEGGEASYHYEEISDYIIKHRLKSKEKIYANIDEIRESFKVNLGLMRSITGLPCVTVASHGEWVNRRIGIKNTELMSKELRREMGIAREVYDEEAMKFVDVRFADQGKNNFIDEIMATVSTKHPRTVYILTHPAQWRADFVGSVKLDFRRIMDEIYYHL